jgi:lipopolysaccharide/colanic/teichoic acid biosynthesis glycosyltransferase
MTPDAAIVLDTTSIPANIDSKSDTRECMKALGAASHSPSWDWRDTLKRLTDLVLVLVFTPPALVLVALAAVAVKLTSAGPAFYTQMRAGRGGRPFTMLKLRTMRHRCEALTGPRWSPPGDSRVTAVGRFLRATHLDELPQLWNVLRGDMSLVGPRPERPEIIESQGLAKLIPGYQDRLSVRPGMAGLAQLWLPPDTDIDSVRRKVDLDLRYIENRGLWLDLRILAATALKLVGAGPRLLHWLAPPAPAVPAAPPVLATRAEWRAALADVLGSPQPEPVRRDPVADRAEVRAWFRETAIPALNELAAELRRHARAVRVAGRAEEAGIHVRDRATGRRELDLKFRVRGTACGPRAYARVLVRDGKHDFVHEYPLDRPVSEIGRAEVIAFVVAHYRAGAAAAS